VIHKRLLPASEAAATMSKLSLLTGIVKGQVNDLTNDIFGESSSSGSKPTDPADIEKARKEEKKKEEAQKAYEEERRKQQEKKEYQREKMRDNIRQKYGIEKPKDGKGGRSSKKVDAAALEDVKKEYNMSEADFRDFKQKVREDEEDQERKGEKFEKKLERRAQKKELKKSVQDSCKTQ